MARKRATSEGLFGGRIPRPHPPGALKTALDSSVVLDILTDDPRWAGGSVAAVRTAIASGSLIIGEGALAEITPALPEGDMTHFLAEWNIQFVPSTQASAQSAGEMMRRYLGRTAAPKRVMADFLIGSHAACHAGRLLARDRGYYRDYFDGLVIVDPSTTP